MSSKSAKIFDTDVFFYPSDEPKIVHGEIQKEFETDLNFVTIASAFPQDVLIEDYQFKEASHIHINFLMHNPIQFDLPAMSLKELIWNISKIYMEIFKSYKKEARVCCSGHEFLYLKKINIHPGNIISLTISQKIKS